MKILFLHPNMPGQYKYLCPRFAQDPANQVVFITKHKTMEIPNVRRITYDVPRKPSPHTHRYLGHAEQAILQGQEVWRVMKQLKSEGFVPDVICAHPGWGDVLFAKDIYPDTPLFCFFEFYYHAIGADVGFDPEDPALPDDLARVRSKNAHHLLNLVATDWGLSPTRWQHSLHPPEFQSKISVLHDGINTETCKPNPNAEIRLGDNLLFRPGDEVVTYIARNFEPYRGFQTFMRAAEKILRDRPNCHIIAVGADEVSYGKKAAAGTTYRREMMKQVSLDMNRIHFVGTLPYNTLIQLLQVSAAHIYLTYPFVLSWSSMEAMACGCAMVASDTQPVREVITHGETGLLVDFFSPDQVAEAVYQILDDKTRMQAMRARARSHMVQRYSLDLLMPLHQSLVEDIAQRRLPPPTQIKIDALDHIKPKAA